MSNISDFIIENGILRKYVGPGGDVVIPEGITKIEAARSFESAFQNHGAITSVTLPEGLEEIGHNSFMGCKNLQRIHLPESLKVIARHAFAGCAKLETVCFPRKLAEIGDYAFRGCGGLTELTIPESVQKIGVYAFSECKNVKRLVLPEERIGIGEAAFEKCVGLVDQDGFLVIGGVLYVCQSEATRIVIPDGIHTISGRVFNDRVDITSVQIPGTVKRIGQQAFGKCTGLTDIHIPDSVTEIGDYAFSECEGFTEIRLPEGAKALGDRAFSGCSNLEKVHFPDGLESIGRNAFGGCKKLKDVQLPDNVVTIHSGAFEDCEELSYVHIPASLQTVLLSGLYVKTFPPQTLVIPRRTLTQMGQIPGTPCFDGGSVLYTVADGEKGNYKLLLTSDYGTLFDKKGNFDWQQYDLLLANNGPKIKMNAAFRTLAMLCRLRWPHQLQEAIKPVYIAHICKNIKRITPYANVQPEDGLVQLLEEIGAIHAKNKKTILPLMGIGETKVKKETVPAPDGVKTPAQIKKEWTFKKLEDGTIRLNSYKGTDIDVVVPDRIGKDQVTVLGSYCLSSASYTADRDLCMHRKKIRSVVVPEGIVTIEDSVFAECTSLESVSLPKTLTQIGSGAFRRCSGLKNVEVPETAKIDSTAFKGCDGLADQDGFVIRNGILFGYCGASNIVNVPSGVKTIGVTAMMGNTHITEIILPEGVAAVKENAFYNCKALKKIHIPATVEEIAGNQWDWYGKPEIHGLTGSYAEHYAQVNQWPFVSTGVMEKKKASDFVIRDGVLTEYKGSAAEVVIPDGVAAIGSHPREGSYSWRKVGAFQGNRTLKKVVIPTGVREIGDDAFSDCSALTELEVPDTVIRVGNAFSRVPWMEAQKPGPVYIGSVLYDCRESGSEVQVRPGTAAIETNAFYNNKTVRKIVLPEGVKRLGDGVFYGCNQLEEIVVPPSVEEIGDYLLPEGQKLKAVSGGVLRRTTKMPAKFKVFYTADPVDTVWITLYQPEKSWQKAVQEALEANTAAVGPVMEEMASKIDALQTLEKAAGNRAAAFAQQWCKFTGKKALQALYDALKAKNHPMVKKLDADETFLQCLQGEEAEDLSGLHPVEAMVVEALTPTPLYEKVLQQIFSGVRYGDSQEICAPRVLAYIVSEYVKQNNPEWSRYISEYEYTFGNLSICPVADEAAGKLDREEFLEALKRLAERNEDAYWLPYARYADEKHTAAILTQMRSWGVWNAYAAGGRKNIILCRTGLLRNDTRSAMLHFDKIGKLDPYAQLRGTDAETLRDTVLSEFGFDANREIRCDLGGNTLRVQIADDLSLTLFDVNGGKTVKSVPKKNAEPALYDQAKAAVSDLKKNIKKVVTNRKNILFADFLSGAKKDAEKWKQSYMGNPVLNSVARLLVWDQEGKTFTLTAEGPVDSRGLPYTLGSAPICVAHPLEMGEEVTAWQNYFVSRNLKQPFEQVWEPAYRQEDIREDRYTGSRIPVLQMTNKEQHGITVWGVTDYSEVYGFDLKDCKLEYTTPMWRFMYGMTNDAVFEMGAFHMEKLTRSVNHILYLLDKWTVTDRILKDDVSVEATLPAFTAAQIREFAALAAEKGCTNCTALLLNYQNQQFPEYDPMAEFTLDL